MYPEFALTKRAAPKVKPTDPLKHACLCVAVAAALFAPTLRYDFVWDDPISVRRWLPALPSLASVFFPPANIPQFPPDYYRPLQLLSYKVDAALGGGAAWAFHGSSLLWHALATALVFLVGYRLWSAAPSGRNASRASALLFACHPIHSESVAWMAARPDSMVAVFGLAALYLVMARKPLDFTRAAVLGFLTLAALLSKETAVALLLLLPFAAWLFSRRSEEPKNHRKICRARLSFALGATAVAGTVYVLLRLVGLAQYRGATLVLPDSFLSLLLAAIGWYTWKLIWPFPQNALVAEVPTSSCYIATALLALSGTLAGGLVALRKQQLAPVYSLVWFWCTLAPSLLLLTLQPTAPVAERYLYLPSIAFSWLVGEAFARSSWKLPGKARKAATASFTLVLAGLIAATVLRNEVWRDNVRLWTDTAAKNQRDGFGLRNLAAALLERGQVSEAERLLQEALRRRNSRSGTHAIYSNLGTVAFLRQDYAQAAAHYRKAFSEVESGDAAYNLAIALVKATEQMTGTDKAAQMREARSWLGRAVSLSPHDAEVHFAYAEVVRLQGDHDLALRHFRHALELGLAEPQAQRARDFAAESAR